jgi:hypothetical protein
MVLLPKIAPPNRDVYGTDYLLYLKHYKAFRSYVISLGKNKNVPKSGITKDISAVSADVPVLRVSSKVKTTLPKKINKHDSSNSELRRLKMLEEKAKTISSIVSLNKSIVDSDGWTTVTPKRRHKKKSTKEAVSLDVKNQEKQVHVKKTVDKVKVVVNPEYTVWHSERAAIIKRQGGSVDGSNSLLVREFERTRPKPEPHVIIDLNTGKYSSVKSRAVKA